ncbi:hypothetical protein BGE01nite_55030 [Brevifollis gellanilyticus]|uniref:Soluble ligand binding domain-containing protein n=2 Tax=Brevifollis gellanilyticus TaxID=748831 RepID=A0A512MHK6_9BACT|nr:hypothetical protein BGE01nite_55030 [Brevifollis gellanilyticus]
MVAAPFPLLMTRLFHSLPLLLVVALGVSACATVKRFTPDLSKIKLPKIKVPMPPMPNFSSLKKITNIIPGMPDTDKESVDDPQMPFNARGTLGYGHTLRLHVYEGSRSPKRIYNDVVMIDSHGVIDLGKAGTARIGGSTLAKAAATIATTFRVNLALGRTTTVHILSVEDTPVVSVRGDVISDEFIPAWEDMTIEQAVRVAGGRKLGSTAHGVYLIREGERRYFSSLESANELEPEPGDIIELSSDI